MEQIYTMFFLFLGNILCETDITPELVPLKEEIHLQLIHWGFFFNVTFFGGVSNLEEVRKPHGIDIDGDRHVPKI